MMMTTIMGPECRRGTVRGLQGEEGKGKDTGVKYAAYIHMKTA
jgi:hypothetical protein